MHGLLNVKWNNIFHSISVSANCIVSLILIIQAYAVLTSNLEDLHNPSKGSRVCKQNSFTRNKFFWHGCQEQLSYFLVLDVKWFCIKNGIQSRRVLQGSGLHKKYIQICSEGYWSASAELCKATVCKWIILNTKMHLFREQNSCLCSKIHNECPCCWITGLSLSLQF